MMNFPSSPALNDEYSFGGKTWRWNGTAWDLLPTESGDFVSPDGFFNFRHAGVGSVTAQLSPTDPNNTTTFTAYSYDLVAGGSGSGTGDNTSVSLSATGAGNNHLLHVNKHGSGLYAKYKSVSVGPGPATGLLSTAATFGWDDTTGLNPYVNVTADFRVNTKHIDEYIDDRVDALIVAGTNITKTYNDGSNTLTLSASGGSGDVSTDPIWDAKGDLVVGTGANTAARLAAGTDGHVLTLDSSTPTGLKWAAGGGGGSPGGSNTHIQFNDGGALGGDADFTWDKTNNVLTFGNSSRIRGPMSSGTAATDVAVQTSVADSATIVSVIPNGSSNTAVLRAGSSSSFAGSGSFGQFGVVGGSYVGITSSKNNPAASSGLDIRIQQLLSGATREVAQFYPSGNVNFGTTTTDPNVAFRVEGAARFDGKVSLGAALVAWDSGFEHIDVGTAAVFSATASAMYLCNNLYYQASSWRYKTAAVGALNFISGTDWYHFTAPSGTAGSAATITQRLRWNESSTQFEVGGKIHLPNAGARITSPHFGSGTIADIPAFQSSTASSYTAVLAIPGTSGTSASFYAANNSTPTNAAYVGITTGPTEVVLASGRFGSGTTLPLQFKIGDTLAVAAVLHTDGNWNLGSSTSNPGVRLAVQGDVIRLTTAKTPASATAAGTTGDICWDSNYVYVCVATNTWKRSALSTW